MTNCRCRAEHESEVFITVLLLISAPADDPERTLVVPSVFLHLREVSKDLRSMFLNTGLICDDVWHLQRQTVKDVFDYNVVVQIYFSLYQQRPIVSFSTLLKRRETVQHSCGSVGERSQVCGQEAFLQQEPRRSQRQTIAVLFWNRPLLCGKCC